MPKALGKKMPKTIVTSVDRGQKVKEAAVLNSKLQLRETAVVNSKVGYDEKLQFKNKLQLSDKLHLSKKVALGNKIELRDAGEKINSAGAYRFKVLQDKRANTSKPNKVNASHYRDRVLSTYSVNTSDTNSNTASRDGNVTFDIDGVEGCGFLSVTGTFDDWSGWGANTDTGMMAEVANGDHEYVILCVNTVDGWWYDIWANSTIFNAPIDGSCWNGDYDYPNYTLSVDGDMTVSVCAGSCEETCAPAYAASDVNADGATNVQDVVSIVGCILDTAGVCEFDGGNGDVNGDGLKQTTEAKLGNVGVYLDSNNNGQMDEGEPCLQIPRHERTALPADDPGVLGHQHVHVAAPQRPDARRRLHQGRAIEVLCHRPRHRSVQNSRPRAALRRSDHLLHVRHGAPPRRSRHPFGPRAGGRRRGRRPVHSRRRRYCPHGPPALHPHFC